MADTGTKSAGNHFRGFPRDIILWGETVREFWFNSGKLTGLVMGQWWNNIAFLRGIMLTNVVTRLLQDSSNVRFETFAAIIIIFILASG